MSYKHLIGRLVEIQRSMVGAQAVNIAQTVDGVTVTEDGNVTAVDGDPCVVLDELVDNYTDMLGEPAAMRFRTAATEYMGELDLPESLGGSVDPSRVDDAGADAIGDDGTEEGLDDPESGVGDPESEVEDTDVGAVESDEESGGGEATPIEISSPREEPAVAGSGAQGTDSLDRTAREQSVEPTSGTVDGSVMVRYTLQNGQSDREVEDDLHSVYLLTEGEDDWQAPVTVADAIASAVANAAGLDRGELDDIEEYVDTDRVLSTLYAESGPPVSFDVRDLNVTLYSDGTVRVHS